MIVQCWGSLISTYMVPRDSAAGRVGGRCERLSLAFVPLVDGHTEWGVTVGLFLVQEVRICGQAQGHVALVGYLGSLPGQKSAEERDVLGHMLARRCIESTELLGGDVGQEAAAVDLV